MVSDRRKLSHTVYRLQADPEKPLLDLGNLMKLSDSDLIAVAEALKSNVGLIKLNIYKEDMGDAGALALAEGLQNNVRLEIVNLHNAGIGDAGVIALAERFGHNKKLKDLFLYKNSIGDAGAIALAKALSDHHRLVDLHLNENAIGDAGAIAIAEMITKLPNLTDLFLTHNCFGEAGVAALEAAIIGGGHKNLRHGYGISEKVEKYCRKNWEAARDLRAALKDFDPNSTVFEEHWSEITQRLAALQKNQVMPLPNFELFLNSLPLLDPEQPVTLEALTTKHQGSDYAPMDNPHVWATLKLRELVHDMNTQGHYLNAAELLEPDGKTPTAFLKRAAQSGQAGALFTYENWAGNPKSELQTVLNALPKTQQETIRNRQQLLLRLERDERMNLLQTREVASW